MSKSVLAIFVFSLSICNTALAGRWDDYYNQFLYVGSCPKPVETNMFTTLHSKQEPTLGHTTAGEAIVASLELQLFADGTYFAKYEEWFRWFDSVSGYSKPEMQKIIKGTWNVQVDQIILDGIGHGEPGGPADIFIFLEKSIISPAIGARFKLSKVKTNMGPEHKCN